jgi:anaerobic magnesium-protoporphyrin IX monomethyl ester cyclase
MRVLLINPPWTYPKKFFRKEDIRVSIPLGLLYIGAVIEKHAEVRIIDSFTLKRKVVHEYPDHFHAGATFEAIEEALREEKPDMIGITSPFTSQIENAERIISIAKRIFPKVPVVIGGPHASVLPLDLLKHGADIAMIGEAEDTIQAIIQRLKDRDGLEGIPGTCLPPDKSGEVF